MWVSQIWVKYSKLELLQLWVLLETCLREEKVTLSTAAGTRGVL